MLVVADNLSAFTMGAGEPFLLQIEFQDSSGAPVDITQRSFVLSFYKADRTLVQQLTGIEDIDGEGEFLRFEEPGSWSEGLYGGASLRVELAERFLNGRNVISTGALTINATAASVPSFGNAQIGTFATRVVLKDSPTPGGVPVFSQHKVAFLPQGYAVPAPSITIAPSIGSDVIPQVGGQLTGVTGSYLNGSVTSRQWVLGGTAIAGANGATYVADAAGQLTYSETVTGAGGTITATSIAVTVAAGQSMPTFTAAPAITGTPQVGAVGAFSFGAISNGVMGTARLLVEENGGSFADAGDASAGSIQWQTAGIYKIRVTVAGSALYEDSDTVAVTVPVASPVPAPSVALATTNADGSAYAAGTNPPRVVLSVPDGLDKTKYRALLYFDQAASGALATDAGHTLTIEDLMAAPNTETATFTAFGNLAAGNFRCEPIFQNKTDGTFGPIGAVLATTLNAKAQAAATTTFDPNNRSAVITLSNNNLSEQTSGDYGGAGYQLVALTQNRTDKRYFEVTEQYKSPISSEYYAVRVAAPGTVPASPAGDPGTAVGFPPIAEGSVYGVLVEPASAEGTNDGKLIVYNPDRSICGQTTHPFAAYMMFVGGTNGYSTLGLNTGQQRFTVFPDVLPDDATRFN